MLKPLDRRPLRPGRRYALVGLGELPAAQRRALVATANDPDLEAVLVPRGGDGSTVKAASREVASLLDVLGREEALPEAVRGKLGPRCDRVVADLVLEGVVEVVDERGEGRSGAAAYDAVFEPHCDWERWERASPASLDALRYAQALPPLDAPALSTRMYLHNRHPLTPGWQRRLPSREATLAYLGLGPGGAVARALAAGWEPQAHDPSWPWSSWSRRGATGGAASQAYKLYVSPAPDALRHALPAIAAALDESEANHLKVGADVHGVLRPDKVVAYFGRRQGVIAAAAALRGALADCAGQAVPFAAALGGDGLLAWGMDPVAGDPVPAWRGPESWRTWVTNRAATAILAAKHDRAPIEPWRFALERLRLDGVDPLTWAPTRDWAG